MERSKGKMIRSVAACMVIQLCLGIVYMWSALKSEVAAAYGWDSSQAGMVYSYMLMAYVVGNFIGGFINDKKGPKLTCFLGIILFALGLGTSAFVSDPVIFDLTYGVMAGFGSGMAYGACISCIQKWMPERMGLATGLGCCSFGLSTVIFTPVINSLMEANRNADGIINFTPVLLITAGIMTVCGLIAAVLIVTPPGFGGDTNKEKTVCDGVTNYTLGQAMKTSAFWAFFFSIFLINGVWNLCVPLIKDLGIVRGLSTTAAIACVSITGIANAAGRLIMAALSDKFGRFSIMYILCVMNVVGAALMTFIGGIGYFGTILLLAFAFGGPSSLNAAMSTDLFGPVNSATNYGAAMMAVGLSSIVFNWISDNVIHASVDAVNGTSEGIAVTFIMAAVSAVIPFFLMLYISHYLKKKKSQSVKS